MTLIGMKMIALKYLMVLGQIVLPMSTLNVCRCAGCPGSLQATLTRVLSISKESTDATSTKSCCAAKSVEPNSSKMVRKCCQSASRAIDRDLLQSGTCTDQCHTGGRCCGKASHSDVATTKSNYLNHKDTVVCTTFFVSHNRKPSIETPLAADYAEFNRFYVSKFFCWRYRICFEMF
jgi:predicted metal-binding protein